MSANEPKATTSISDWLRYMPLWIAIFLGLFLFQMLNRSGEEIAIGAGVIKECLAYTGSMSAERMAIVELDTQKIKPVRHHECIVGKRVDIFYKSGLLESTSYYEAR